MTDFKCYIKKDEKMNAIDCEKIRYMRIHTLNSSKRITIQQRFTHFDLNLLVIIFIQSFFYYACYYYFKLCSCCFYEISLQWLIGIREENKMKTVRKLELSKKLRCWNITYYKRTSYVDILIWQLITNVCYDQFWNQWHIFILSI